MSFTLQSEGWTYKTTNSRCLGSIDKFSVTGSPNGLSVLSTFNDSRKMYFGALLDAPADFEGEAGSILQKCRCTLSVI